MAPGKQRLMGMCSLLLKPLDWTGQHSFKSSTQEAEAKTKIEAGCSLWVRGQSTWWVQVHWGYIIKSLSENKTKEMKQRNKPNLPTPGQIQTWESFYSFTPQGFRGTGGMIFFFWSRETTVVFPVQVHNFQMSWALSDNFIFSPGFMFNPVAWIGGEKRILRRVCVMVMRRFVYQTGLGSDPSEELKREGGHTLAGKKKNMSYGGSLSKMMIFKIFNVTAISYIMQVKSHQEK